MKNFLEKTFHISQSGSSIKQEIIGGATTFLTMAYIIFVQPAILSQCGMNFDSVMVATCIASAAACFIMAILANYPIALAPAMGHNVYFAFVACPFIASYLPQNSQLEAWQIGLGAVCLSGIIFILVSFFGLREKVIHSIPYSLRNAIAVGIGLLIALVGFEWSGITISHPVTYLSLGKLSHPAVLLSICGLVVISILLANHIRGAILWGILITTLIGIVSGIIHYQGIFSPIPSLKPTFLKLSFKGIFHLGFLEIIFVFFFLDLFDTVGTLIGIGEKGGFIKNNILPRARQALFSDASATIIGASLGTSTVTSYIESAAGVSQGAKTGFANIITGLLMLAALFCKPLIATIGSGYKLENGIILYPAIGPALIIVGAMMMSCVKNINWEDMTEAIPAFLTITIMPFCGFSITEGISFGFISYTILKYTTHRKKEVPGLILLFAILFMLRYIFIAKF